MQIEIHCKNCDRSILRNVSMLNVDKKRGRKLQFCSYKCSGSYYSKLSKLNICCTNCAKIFTRKLGEISSNKRNTKTNNQFCSKSCSAIFNNKTRKKSRRSKAESLLYTLIKNEFPNLEVINNDRSFLDGYELDIFIPSIKLAVEWNGIVHFQPIYGQEKLDKIQEIDSIKCKLAELKGINLIVIPDLKSTKNYVNEVFDRIKELIYKLIEIAGPETASG
jgi:hypothetical protein